MLSSASVNELELVQFYIFKEQIGSTIMTVCLISKIHFLCLILMKDMRGKSAALSQREELV